MKLSVIINHYRTPEVLRNCIKSVQKDLEGGDIEAEIILTDGGTQEVTRQMMQEEFPKVVFLEEKKNIGFGRMINRAFRVAYGDYYLILNADILLDEPGVIKKMLDYMDAHAEVGMVGPKLWNINNTWQQSCFRFYSPLTVLFRRTPLGKTAYGKRDLDRFLMKDILAKGEITEPLAVDWLMGSAMLVRKKDVEEKVGEFDERYFMYFEDVDWARRFWEKGLKVIYYPKVTMYHYHFQASKKGSLLSSLLNKYTRIHISSAIKYFSKFGLKKVQYGE